MLEHEGSEEYSKSYPRRIQLKDGSVRTVNSAEEEAQVHQEEREQD